MLKHQEPDEILKSAEDCSLLGETAQRAGKHELAISLFKYASELEPGDIRYKFQQIHALMRIDRYEEAYIVTDEAEKTQDIPNYFSIQKFDVSYHNKNWSASIEYAKYLLEKYPPENNRASADIARFYLEALREDGKLDMAITETKKYIVALAKQISHRSVFFDCIFGGLYEEAVYYARTISDRIGSNDIHGVSLDNLLLYVDMAVRNESWVRTYAPDVKIISIGQNCLPFSLTRRLGLNTLGMSEENLTIFDLGGASNNLTAKLLETDFADMFDRSRFSVYRLPRGIPMMRHKGNGMGFFHECGECRIGPNRDRFHEELNRSIENFRRISSNGKRLFIYSVVGPCDLDKIISSWFQRFSSESARLLVIDCLKDPISSTPYSDITYVHIPYPDGYNWNFTEDFTTDRGRDFEQKIGATIRSEMLALQTAGGELTVQLKNAS